MKQLTVSPYRRRNNICAPFIKKGEYPKCVPSLTVHQENCKKNTIKGLKRDGTEGNVLECKELIQILSTHIKNRQCSEYLSPAWVGGSRHSQGSVVSQSDKNMSSRLTVRDPKWSAGGEN